MSQSQEKSMFPHTGNKLFDALIVIIDVLSIIGIVIFGYEAIMSVVQGPAIKMLPSVMYVLMYISILRYSIDYFARGKMVSMNAMLTRYCMLTLMSTLTLPNITTNYLLIILTIVVIILVPMMSSNLTKVKRCAAIIAVVFIIVAIITGLKYYYGYVAIERGNPFGFVDSWYVMYHPLLVWVMFSLLYYIRIKVAVISHKEEIEEKGIDAVLEGFKSELDEALESEKATKKQAKAEKKEKMKEKLHSHSDSESKDGGSIDG